MTLNESLKALDKETSNNKVEERKPSDHNVYGIQNEDRSMSMTMND